MCKFGPFLKIKLLPGHQMGKREAARKARAKAKQASKLSEIRAALVAAGFETVDEQASALGVGRATAWALLNRDKKAGPSAAIIKRILSSPNLPSTVRKKVNEYVEEKIVGLYGHSEIRRRLFALSLYAQREKADPIIMTWSRQV